MKFTLNITPQTSPRPRFGKHGAYMPAKYMKYKKDLCTLITSLKIEAGDYDDFTVWFYFPYPKSTPKKDRAEGAKYKKKPDWDNCGKGICDVLKDAFIIDDDNQICDASVKKRYTTEPVGRIIIELN